MNKKELEQRYSQHSASAFTVPIRWLLPSGVSSMLKREPSHAIIFTNGCKERSGSDGRALDLGSKGCMVETHQIHSVVSSG